MLFSRKMMWVTIRQEFLGKECLIFITIWNVDLGHQGVQLQGGRVTWLETDTCSCCLISIHTGGPCPSRPQLEIATASWRPLLSAGPPLLAPPFTPSPGCLRVRFPKTCQHLLGVPPLHALKERGSGQQVPGTGQTVKKVPFRSVVINLPPDTHTDMQTCSHRPTIGGEGGLVKLALKEEVNHRLIQPDPVTCFRGNFHVCILFDSRSSQVHCRSLYGVYMESTSNT